jgi:carbonic anhydrase/acetyltransferase-like protein (isoleucine patch superfamily)
MNIRTFKNNTPTLGQRVMVDDSAVLIGNVTLGDDSSVWPATVIRGDVNNIHIGERTSIQDGTVLHVSHANNINPEGDALMIGDDVTVGHRVVLHGCTIGDECLIGINSVVLDKAVLQKHVLLGANSLVPPGKVLESGYLYLGSPVKQVRRLTEAELAYFKYSAEHYVTLKDEYL